MINDRPVKQTALTKACAHSNPVPEENEKKKNALHHARPQIRG